jgi:hypothetical protein
MEPDDFPENGFADGLPEEAAWRLRAAAGAYHLEPVAEAHLLGAQAVAPRHPAVLIGLYRFYFYKGRLEAARAVAETCLDVAAELNGLALDWRRVRAGDARFGEWGAAAPRFWLFTLKAWAYLNMRLGDLPAGRLAVTKLLELDPSDKVGAGVLLEVLDRAAEDEACD